MKILLIIVLLFLLLSLAESCLAQTTASTKLFEKEFKEADSVFDTLVDIKSATFNRFMDLGKQITSLRTAAYIDVENRIQTLKELQKDILQTVLESDGKDPLQWYVQGYDEKTGQLIIKPIPK